MRKNQNRSFKIKFILGTFLIAYFISFAFFAYKIDERKKMIKESTLSGVVVSNPILYSLVLMVTDGIHQPTLLITGNESKSIHDYKLKPSQIKTIQEANIVFMIADEMETFLINAIPVSKKVEVAKAKSISIAPYKAYDMDKFLNKVSPPNLNDYHIWLDPVQASKILTIVYEKVIEIDTHNANQYKRNLEKAQNDLLTISKEVNNILRTAQNKKFITYHNSLGYFQKAFGINIVGSIFTEDTSGNHGHTHSGDRVRASRPSEVMYLEEALNFIETSDVNCLIRDDEIPKELNFGVKTKVEEIKVDLLGFNQKPTKDLYKNVMINLATELAKCNVKKEEAPKKVKQAPKPVITKG